MIDKFHLIVALPYVDEIVSDDDFFHKIYPVAQKAGTFEQRCSRSISFWSGFDAFGAIIF